MHLNGAAAHIPRGVPILVVDGSVKGILHVHVAVAFSDPNSKNSSKGERRKQSDQNRREWIMVTSFANHENE